MHPKTNHATFEQANSITLLAPDYVPNENEPYMNPTHLEFFRQKLNEWKYELLRESVGTIHNMQEQSGNEADIADRASTETDRARELRTRDRERKLIGKIDDALRRIDEGTYGYCEETGDPIGITRLCARPTATLSFEAQEQHEKEERIYREA